MKKAISMLLATALAGALALPLSACGKDEDNIIHVYMPDGAPAIALAALMDSGYKGFDFTVVPSTEIGGVVSNGTADMAIMPIDAAARLYNGGTDIVMLTVNTHGNLYIVGKQANITFNDLKGSKLGVIGQGSVPDNTLRMLLDDASISYEQSENAVGGKVAITYNEATTLIPMFKQNKLDYLLLGEPAVTNAVSKTAEQGGQISMNMQEQWTLAFGGEFPQACLVAKGSLIKNKKSEVNKFIKSLGESDGWAKQNPDKARKAVADNMKKGNATTLQNLTGDIIDRCNIKTVSAKDSRAVCATYFEKLSHLTTPLGTTVLNKAPDLEFYYQE